MAKNLKPNIPENISDKWQKIVDLISNITSVPAALVMRVHPSEIEVFVSSDSDGNPYIPRSRESLNSGLYCETVMKDRSKLLVPDALADPKWINNPDIKLNMKSYLGFPLIWSDGEVFGTICVLDSKANAYSEEHSALIQQFSEIVAGDLHFLEEIALRKQTEEELHNREQLLEEVNERFRLAFQTSPDSININRLDDGMYIDINDGFQSITGYTRDDAIGKTSLELNIWKNPEDRAQLVEGLSQKGFYENLEAEFVRKDGTICVGLMSARVINLRGTPCIISVTRDITEHRQLEEEARKAERLEIELEKERELVALKDRILSIMSHDFRTPLSIIQTSSDLIARYGDKMSHERQQRSIIQIQEQIATLNKMIDDILIVGRGRAGKIDFRPSSLELVSFCRLLFDQMQFADESKRQYEFINDEDRIMIEADGNLLQHILMNIFSNADKYSFNTGLITCEVRLKDDHAMITVRDEGIGIPEKDIDLLFDPFHRADNVEAIKGTGLGLSIVKQYVELHGGLIEVESKIGTGSTFIVTLPVLSKMSLMSESSEGNKQASE